MIANFLKLLRSLLEHWQFDNQHKTRPQGGFSAIISVVEELPMNPVELSELIDELREIAIYETDPQDWMGYLESDDYWVPDRELAH